MTPEQHNRYVIWRNGIIIVLILSLLIILNSCRHFDRDSNLTVTVLDVDENRVEGATVSGDVFKGKMDSWPRDEVTDEDGEVTYVLEDWGNGTAWGITLEFMVILGGDTLEIETGDRELFYQNGRQYDGEDFKHTIQLK